MSTTCPRLALAWLAVTVLAVAGCGGSDGEPVAPPAIEARAVRQVENGVALRRTVIEVTFEAELPQLQRDAPLSSYFDVVTPSARAQDGTERMAVRSVRAAGDVLELTVDRPIAVDSTLFIDGAFFGEGGEAEELTIASSLSPFAAALATYPLVPADPAVVEAGPPPEPGDLDANDEAMKQAMLEHMRRRGSPEEVLARAALAYDSISPEVVPAPKLRAALGAFTGTFAEPAITWLLTETNCTGAPVTLIDFREVPDGGTLLARVTYDEDGRRTVSIRPDLAGERIEHLMPLLAHEAIHCDGMGSVLEEVAAASFDTLLYLQLLSADASLAQAGTPLARNLNIDAIAMINSGRRHPESIGVLQSEGVTQALPATNLPARSYAEHIATAYAQIPEPESPPEVLAETYAVLLASTAGLPEGSAFDLVYLDELLGRSLREGDLARVVAALSLQP